MEQDDLQLASLAYQRLRELRKDDNSRVSLAATEAIQRIAVSFPQASLDLGHGVLNGPPLSAEIAAVGPPLALASPVRTSNVRLHAAIDGSSLKVSADATETGRMDESVAIETPAGHATLIVTGFISNEHSKLQVAGFRSLADSIPDGVTTAKPWLCDPRTHAELNDLLDQMSNRGQARPGSGVGFGPAAAASPFASPRPASNAADSTVTTRRFMIPRF
jgi:hypothetical protein